MADTQKVKSNRDKYLERLKAKYPDKEYADDEALFGQANDDYDAYDADAENYRKNADQITGLFAKDPRSAAFISKWSNGEDPVIAMVREYGDDFKAALDDPDMLDRIAEANKENLAKAAKAKEYEEQYKKNLEQTVRTMEETGVPDKEMDDIMEFLIGITKDAVLGKFTRETILMAQKALGHDTDVESARKEGEVAGRNARIDMKLRKRGRSDGTADLAGKNGGGGTDQRPDLGALDRGYGSSSIWERGGEKRRPAR